MTRQEFESRTYVFQGCIDSSIPVNGTGTHTDFRLIYQTDIGIARINMIAYGDLSNLIRCNLQIGQPVTLLGHPTRLYNPRGNHGKGQWREAIRVIDFA